ncbi:MAG: VOC family protein [Proteobacteria bacterium]|nr:VOC family protein [Pseudomonadota bacterium]
MSSGITSLDHVAVMVTDLDAAGASYERLGFRLTPLSQHSGALSPGGKVDKWGVANRCIMLRRGYLELMGVVDPALYDNRVPDFLARYEGIHILAFGCEDAVATANALAAAGFGATGVHALSRVLDTPEGERLAKFNLVRLPPEETPEGRVLAIEHVTPEYLWQERYLDHPNGAMALTELVVCVDDVNEAARRYARYFGIPFTRNGMAAECGLLVGKFLLMEPDGLRNSYGIDPPTLPFAASFTIAVADLPKTRHLLETNGVAVARHKGGLMVAGSDAHGAIVVFEPLSGEA